MEESKMKSKNKFLSTDLTGFENFMLSQKYNSRYLYLLMRAPIILFELYGSRAGFEFLQSEDYISNFKNVLEDRYMPGTIARLLNGIQHYHDYLVNEGVLEKKADPIWRKPYIRKEFVFYYQNGTPYYHEIEDAYSEFMDIEKAYCADEKRKRLASYRKFVSFLIKNKISTLENVTGLQIVEFGRLQKTLKTDWNYLKYFLKFAYRHGFILEDFSKAFLSRKNLRIRKKRFLTEDKIESIVASINCETVTEKRDFSMIHLMSELALRPSETIRIKLKDIDWVNSRLHVCGKGNKKDWVPLTNDLAISLTEYLKCSANLRREPEYLFLGERPPFKRLRTHRHLSKVLSDAYEKTEIKPPSGDVRLNVFRHSKATEIVNTKGQNFFTAQSLLRHSSPEMTMHYAKFHSKRQPIFEFPWPESVS